MSGSGPEEVWQQVYAKTSVAHMTSGHAYSRALRAHFLTQIALVNILLQKYVDLNQNKKEELLKTYTRFLQRSVTSDDVASSEAVVSLAACLEKALAKAALISRTCKLWCQYINQVSLMQLFIRAERTGDWQLHLNTVKENI